MTGSLQEKNGKFYIVLNLKNKNGKRKQKWIGTDLPIRGNKKRAEQLLRKTLIDYELKESNMSGKDIPFTDYIEFWLNSHKAQVDIITWQGYREIVHRHILPHFESLNLELSEVSAQHIQNYYDYKFANGRCDGKGGLSARSVQLHGAVLNLIFKSAVRKELIISNPAARAKLPARDKSFKGNFYTIEQANTLLKKCEGQFIYPIVYLTLHCGLRRSEVLGLKWDAVDFQNKRLSIRRTVVLHDTIEEKETTKNHASRRSYPMTEDILVMLQNCKTTQDTNRTLFGSSFHETDYVFTWPDGRMIRPGYVSQSFRKLLKKEGLPLIRFHDLRHTTASILLSKGWTLKDIQEWLGHSDITITANLYTHVDITRKQLLAKSLAGTFAAPEMKNEQTDTCVGC